MIYFFLMRHFFLFKIRQHFFLFFFLGIMGFLSIQIGYCLPSDYFELTDTLQDMSNDDAAQCLKKAIEQYNDKLMSLIGKPDYNKNLLDCMEHYTVLETLRHMYIYSTQGQLEAQLPHVLPAMYDPSLLHPEIESYIENQVATLLETRQAPAHISHLRFPHSDAVEGAQSLRQVMHPSPRPNFVAGATFSDVAQTAGGPANSAFLLGQNKAFVLTTCGFAAAALLVIGRSSVNWF